MDLWALLTRYSPTNLASLLSPRRQNVCGLLYKTFGA